MSIPESVLREIERAIQAAEFPRGMSVHDGKAKVDSSHLRRLLAELAALRAELESAHAAQRHAETELSQYMAWYAMAEHQHLHEQRLREKAEAERDALKTALLVCARQAEALKRDCGMDPESPQAIRNAQYQNISTTAHIALGTIRGPRVALGER